MRFVFLSPRRRSGERTEERGIQSPSSPRPSPPSDGGERVKLVAAVEPWFSLTLSLSLGEWAQQAPVWSLADGRWANSGTGVIERRWTVLPLPKGEGRGEGKASVAQPTVTR